MKFENGQLIRIEDISQNYSLEIPEYQRGYAWDKKQWSQLWEDLLNTNNRKASDHYAGSLMFRHTGPENALLEHVEVVDGQQRLITISLLLQAFGHEALAIRFHDNEPIQTYFDFYAGGRQSLAPRLGQFKSFYGSNIAAAAQYYKDQVASLTAPAHQALLHTLLTRFKFFVLSIQPGFDIHVAFETINNRGRPLTTLEKLKNRLIYLSSLYSETEGSAEAKVQVHSCWKSIYHWLGKGSILLDDDEFLRAHALGWFQQKNEAGWLEEQLFTETFAEASSNLSPTEIIRYVQSLETASAWWHHLNHPADLPVDAQRSLNALRRVRLASAMPTLLWALVRLGEIDKRLVGNPSGHLEWSKSFVALVNQAERFSMLLMQANERRSNTGRSDLNHSAFALAHPGIAIDSQHEDTGTPPRAPVEAVHFAAAHLKSLIYNFATGDEAEDADFLDERFPWEGYFDPKKTIEVAAGRLRSGHGFYGWHFSKLVIYEWETWLRGDKGLPEKMPWEVFTWDQTVEHIYPQTARDPAWNSCIKVDGRSAALQRSITNSLGNLLFLSSSRNSSVSNAAYRNTGSPKSAKRDRYRSGSYSEWQVAEVCTDWNVASIAARGIAMMRLAQKRWDWQLVSPDARLTEWMPFLFGDHAEKIMNGETSGGRAIDGRSLNALVERFESVRPG